MAEAPDDAIERLYGLPLDEFVRERDALAKSLRGEKRRDEATAVKALAKPTVAAWAVNQAVRSQAAAARELWEAGDALAAAQGKILAGKGSGADLRAASERERAAVEPLVDAARGLLSSSGGDLTETTLERVRQTLHAGAIDPDARDEIAAGRAVRERAPRGLFGGDAEPPAPRARGKQGGRAEAAAPSARGKADRGRSGAAASGAAKPASGAAKPANSGRGATKRDAAAAKRQREEAAAQRREAEAERKRVEAAEREERATQERARKEAAKRVTKAERTLAHAEGQSASAAQRLEEARACEREAADELAAARAVIDELES